MNFRIVLAFIYTISLFSFDIAFAENWPQWRGPNANGVAANGSSYPTSWSTSENVAWKVALPGSAGSTPIVWDDKIFVTCPDNGNNSCICIDRSGKKLWQAKIGSDAGGKHKKGSGSNPSPVTDGELVYVYYRSGDLAAIDFSGEIVWHKNLQELIAKDNLWWDLGTSPVLTRKHVVIACMQTGESYVVGIDKKTGNIDWKQDRNLDAPVEANQSYSTPLVVEQQGKESLIILGADHITAHDAENGKEIWRVGGLNPDQEMYFRSIASPVISNGLVIAPYARGDSLTAVRLDGHGDVTKTHIKWSKFDGSSADVPTPAAQDGKLFICADKGKVTCMDIDSGRILWEQQVEKNRNAFSSSPIATANHVYLVREDGRTFVIENGDEFKLVETNDLDEFTVATPVFVDGSILIRTAEHLYCIKE